LTIDEFCEKYIVTAEGKTKDHNIFYHIFTTKQIPGIDSESSNDKENIELPQE